MAEPLKNQFGPEVPKRIAAMIEAVHPAFPSDSFVAEALCDYEPLELMNRGRKVASALRPHLPDDFERAASILIDSFGPTLETTENFGMETFLYLPHAFFIQLYGVDHFDAAMRANYELTQRFTAEFSVRPYLMRYQERTLALLETWATDASVHVRRLVSEGTRSRLPWASRLPAFQRDPTSVVRLLELLKDDPELYVRRSVANNLNDIGKDNPQVLLDVAREWMQGADNNRVWLVRHALRTLIKRGHPEALDILGYGDAPSVDVVDTSISPAYPVIGDKLQVRFGLVNTGKTTQRLLADLVVHYVKADKTTAPKVFKLKELALEPGQRAELKKNLTLKQMTTRTHHPGEHRIQAQVNGHLFELGNFVLES